MSTADALHSRELAVGGVHDRETPKPSMKRNTSGCCAWIYLASDDTRQEEIVTRRAHGRSTLAAGRETPPDAHAPQPPRA
jgi:hypothetical protein